MPIVPVTALQEFTYRGARIAKGAVARMEAVDAAIAARKGDVSLDRGLNARSLQAQEAAPSPPRRRYRRRDLQADE